MDYVGGTGVSSSDREAALSLVRNHTHLLKDEESRDLFKTISEDLKDGNVSVGRLLWLRQAISMESTMDSIVPS